MPELTQQRLKELMSYDHETGVFVRKVAVMCGRRHNRTAARAGEAAGYLHPTGYLFVRVDGKPHRMHRLAWLYVHGEFPPDMLDHIDGNKKNNAISNLRLATNSQNQQNKRNASSRSATGLLGVSFHKATGKYRATIKAGDKSVWLGCFATPDQASAAYWAAKTNLHEYAPQP